MGTVAFSNVIYLPNVCKLPIVYDIWTMLGRGYTSGMYYVSPIKIKCSGSICFKEVKSGVESPCQHQTKIWTDFNPFLSGNL